MKKRVIAIMLLTMCVILTACEDISESVEALSTESVASTEKSTETPYIIDITNTYSGQDLKYYMDSKTGITCMCYDDDYRYYIQTRYWVDRYITVTYSNGRQEDLRSAIRFGRATISDLDRFEINYKKKDRQDPDAIVEFRRTNRSPEMLADVGNLLFISDGCAYILSDFFYNTLDVYYENGEYEDIKEASKNGRISPEDLDFFEIPYSTDEALQ